MKRLSRVLSVALLCTPALALAEEGWFGFSQRVEVGWLLNVESAVVNDVEKSSPAERAGIAVGDAFLSIEDCAIPGCGAYKAKSLMEKTAGEALRLKLKKQNGEEYTAVLVAEPQPKEPK